jgi:DNA-binding protein YbaB|tara:strand:- start:10934 stop:11227 length:294 start_codon:yes stop_codon:yes gene_type:complete
MNPKNLKAAFQMRSQMKEIQKKLKQTTVTESDKNEEIMVTVDGTFKVKEIKLNITELDQTRIKKLENNLLSTINKAIEKSQKNANSQLGSITNLLGM